MEVAPQLSISGSALTVVVRLEAVTMFFVIQVFGVIFAEMWHFKVLGQDWCSDCGNGICWGIRVM